MSHFVTGVSEELKEECRASILHGNIGLSMLMVHSQLVEESRLNQRNREAKREKWFVSGFSKSRLDFQENTKFNKRF